MRIIHIVGARPNFMKVAPVHEALCSRTGINQAIIHTGQHYDSFMSDVFFRQLNIPSPDYNLNVGSGSHAQQTAEIMIRMEPIILKTKPDLVLVYGDVNSTIAAALVCSKLLVPLGHVEAGLRSFDRRMPEEVNRVLTDRVADYLFTPSVDGNENLIHEGVSQDKIYLVGNVMIDTLIKLLPHAGSAANDGNPYALVTLHRPSNVDDPAELGNIIGALNEIASELDIIFPVHPRTRQMLHEIPNLHFTSRLKLVDPVGYLEFLGFQRNAKVVITDSGGIQEETTFLGVPCLTLRENTERPVTVTVGTNLLIGSDLKLLKEETRKVLSGEAKKGGIPPLWDGKAGERIADVIQGFQKMKTPLAKRVVSGSPKDGGNR
jgi:UDP-N-acetylglucosamine 2-epimerase (non-hydrolysing)